MSNSWSVIHRQGLAGNSRDMPIKFKYFGLGLNNLFGTFFKYEPPPFLIGNPHPWLCAPVVE